MNYQTLSASLLEQGVRLRTALVQLPVQARSVLIGAGVVVMAMTILALGNIF